ncbi:MDR family MFS transporter [Lactococcus insecticola]|uniref:MFS transporter n=1 Tax=Pseudolactococcus insecticola TaxID=2709158 RepID=A0A6A0B9D8_9LACT|nr:MDR family MFS transporter [Lactococcus insecticola]GFH40437.1 MFS transporter [Lactococcus insecticola]
MTTTQKIPHKTMLAAWTIMLAAIAPMLDSTMVNIAVKELTHDFATTLGVIQWGITGYVLALAVAVPVSGWLMNRFDGKKVLMAATLAFGLTSVLAGFSWTIETFIAFRLLQGFSAGIITPLMSTLLVKTAGPENIGKIISIVTTPMIFGPIFGPVLGGFIVEFASWRWIFYINVAVVVISLVMMRKNLPDFPAFDKTSRLDIPGISLLSLMSVALIFGVSKAADQASFANANTLIWLLLGLIFAGAYVIYDKKNHGRSILPLALFRHRTFKATSIGLFLANIAIMGPMLILPLFFQNVLHLTTIGAALALIPQGLGMLVTRPYIGKMIDRIGAKQVVLVSLVVCLIGSVPLIFITAHTSLIWLSIVLFIRGASFGGVNIPLSSDAYTGLDDKELPQAGVGVNIIENLGASFGTALLATIVAATTIGKGMIAGFHAGFLASAIVLALIFLPAVFLTKK